LAKIPLIYSVSYLNFGGRELCLATEPTNPPRGDGN